MSRAYGSFGWKAAIARRLCFWLCGPMRYLVAAVLALALPLNAASPRSQTTFDSRGNIARFYGVPMRLSISELKHLPYHVKMGHAYAEGDSYSTATIDAHDGVQVLVSFGPDKQLYYAETASSQAVGPKGVGVGSLLSAVRASWPAGRLIYGVEENEAFVTFMTGANVLYLFDPEDMPPRTFVDRGSVRDVPNIRVRRIRVFNEPVSVPKACVPGYCL
jgi:hypothetical protein